MKINRAILSKVAFWVSTMLLMGVGLASAQGGTPTDTISYQGYLTDSAGSPIDSTLDMKVEFFAVSSDGTALYSETHSDVTVSQGQFNLNLGGGTTSDVWSDVDFSQTLWLEITLDPTGTPETLSPRVQLSTVAYARFAFAIADNAVTPTKLNGITGNGTSGQVVSSDGSGGFSWADAGSGGSVTMNYYSTSVAGTDAADTVYVACTAGKPTGGGCTGSLAGFNAYDSCPATGAGQCTTTNPTGWSITIYENSGETATCYVACAQ